MKRVLTQIMRILTREQKRGILLLMAGGLVLALLDTISVALMAPFMTLLTDLGGYEESIFGKLMANTFGVTSKEQAILILTIGFIVLYIVRGVLKIAYQFWQARAIANYRADLATRLFSNVMHKPYSYHLAHNSAETQRLVSVDVSRCFVMINNLISSVSYLLTVAGIVVVLVSMDVKLTMILFAVILLFMLWVRKGLKKHIDRYSGRSHRANTAIYSRVSQAIGGLKSILVKRKQDFYVERYAEQARVAAECESSYQAIDMVPKVLVDTGCMLLVFGTVLVELLLGKDLNATLPLFAAFAVAAMRMIPIVSNLTSVINNVSYFKPSMDALYEVVVREASDLEVRGQRLEVREGTESEGSRIREKTLFEGITLSHIGFKYEGATEALYEDLNLKIPARKSVAFVGVTGSGKTTLADIILGLHKPLSGKVLADGVDIAEHPEWWASLLGYIPQFVYLCDDTIRANVAFGEERENVDDEWVWKCLERAQMREFVESLPEGLDTITGENGVRLSGGQRQRIGIARALYTNPQFLVMDEATSSLDGETEQAIVSAINDLSGDITILIIAHRLSTIENCDLVYRIEDGKATLERSEVRG
jgi:ABC-type multidrug transport system fused ATPase/permease subunit